MKNSVRLSITFLVIGSVVGLAWANKACQPSDPVNIMISPNTLVLHSLCKHITVHSNIPYDSVDAATVFVNGVEVDAGFWADDCGDLVARVSVDSLGELEAGDLVLTLCGSIDGEGFEVSETITVRE